MTDVTVLDDGFAETVETAAAAGVRQVMGEDGWAPLLAGRTTRSAAPESGLRFARLVRSLAAGRGVPQHAAQFAETVLGDRIVAKALAAGSGAAGGFLVPEEIAFDVVEALRPVSVVRAAGATVVPMEGGTLLMPRIAGGAVADYVGENQPAPRTEPGFSQIRMTAHKLAAIVPVSNDLIRQTRGAADRIVRDDLVAALGQREDAAFLRDPGTGNAPKGLRWWAPVGQVFAAAGTTTLASVTTDLGKLVLALKQSNGRLRRPVWFLAPRTEQYLMTVRDGSGRFAFRDEMVGGTLWGYGFQVSTQIPITLGGGGDQSEIILADMADAVIAEQPGLLIDASPDAAYHDGTGLVAAFSLDQTVIRCIALHDFAMRHDASVAVLTGVTWTP
ncbi:MAG: phage major capsid protein [Alphaproteobacteria bacterium]|nr:phage major capsid protein [Alphaproteobacteria bacterium]